MNSKYTILKGILLAVLFAFWIPFFLPSGIYSSVPFDQVVQKVTADLDTAVYQEQDAQAIRRYIGADPSQYENIALYRVDDAMSASELLIASTEDQNALDQLEKAVDARIASQDSIYEGYAPEQKALVEGALQDRQKNYYIYYIGSSPSSTDMDARYQAALRGN